MITLSKQTLKREAIDRGYRPEILEKVYRLLDLLESLMEIDYLRANNICPGLPPAGDWCMASNRQSFFPMRRQVDEQGRYIDFLSNRPSL